MIAWHLGFGLLQIFSAAAAWTKVHPAIAVTEPSSRTDHSLIYDIARSRAMLFGGYDIGQGSRNDVWEWDGVSSVWSLALVPGAKPTPRYLHAMVYDQARAKGILFGGQLDTSTAMQTTWEWDGAAGTWTDVTPPDAGPAPRVLHAMAYDSARRRTVLFGGHAYGTQVNDTWEWDATTWHLMTPTPPAVGPSPRARHAFAYDPVREVSVLFGGHQGEVGPAKDDVWSWDGGSWTSVTPTDGTPGPRNDSTMVFDPDRGRMLLFGGFPPRADVWEWDGTRWHSAFPENAGPGQRTGSAMTFDAVRRRPILAAGDDRIEQSDVWEYDAAGPRWSERTLPRPEPRREQALATDSRRGVVLLVAGKGRASGMLDDTWRWSATLSSGSWENVTPAGARPSARMDHALAYDEPRDRVLLFGGLGNAARLSDTWLWDGPTSTWLEVPATEPSPAARAGHAIACAPARGCLLFGGEGNGGLLGDSWRWNGSSWTEAAVAPPGPTPRRGHAMAYDSIAGEILLFGGAASGAGGLEDDLWAWDGTTWNEQTAQGDRPPPRTDHAVAFDPRRNVLVLYGGTGASYPPFTDTWEWHAADRTWVKTPTEGVAGSLAWHSLAYDPGRREVLSFGGGSDTYQYGGETWSLHANDPPTLSHVGDRSVAEQQRLVIELTGHDPEEDPLLFSAAPLPPGASFDTVQGVFDWTPGCSDAGVYPLRISVSDGQASASESIVVAVFSKNCQPTLDPIASAAVAAGDPLEFLVTAHDPDDDPLSFSAEGAPAGASIDDAGTFRWTPKQDQLGVHPVVLIASDGALYDRKHAEITVVPGRVDHEEDESPAGANTIEHAERGCGCHAFGTMGDLSMAAALGVLLARGRRRRMEHS